MLDGDGDVVNSVIGSDFMAAIQDEARAAMAGGARRNCVYETSSGRQEILIEPIQAPIALVICGVATGAAPLARIASQLGWRVTITDPRPTSLDPGLVPDAACVIAPRERLLDFVTFDGRTAAVVMTHNYEWDLSLLTQLLPSSARYVGLLGSHKRAQRVWSDLHDSRLPLTAQQRERFHSPAGLDIGSETPDEIALSIIAEIQAAMSDRAGGALRDRREAIHSFETIAISSSPESLSAPIHACAR